MTQRSEQMSETLVGAAVIAVAVGFLVFAVARAGSPSESGGYALVARFDRVDGIAPGADVRLSGVKVGSVTDVSLDTADYRARVALAVQPGVQVPDDSVARVASDGLLGGAFISIDAGASESMLPPQGEFEVTQGSVDLLTLFASFARQQPSSDGGGGDGGAEAAP